MNAKSAKPARRPSKPHFGCHLEKTISRRVKEGFTFIQVILGPRQVGKTTAIQNVLKRYSGSSLYVTAEESLSFPPNWVNQIWLRALDQGPETLLVIDEIQKVPDWANSVKLLWDKQKIQQKSKIKLVLLGSSSVNLHVGLTESLTGRFELIRAYHWSLQESQQIKNMSLTDYLKFGGYPGSYAFIKDTKRFENYISNSIVSTVIEKDLLTTGKVRNPALFTQTFQLLQSLPATEMSYTKMLRQLQEKGNTELIKNYLNLYEGAFLFTQVYKFHKTSFRTRLSTPKVVCMAPALLRLGDKESPEFLGKCFESLVGADLIKDSLPVYYWREGDYEVDFLVELKGQLIAVEVKTYKNKNSKSLTEFKKTYPKAEVVYIDFDNYLKFAAAPSKFLLSRI